MRHREQALRFYSQFIRKGDVCFDVGANVGNRTEIFLELGATVVCVEPQQVCLNHLAKMFGNNNNVIIVAKAIGKEEGLGELQVCEDASVISTMSDKWRTEGRFSKNYTWNATQQVRVTTLDSLVAEYGLPSFCKIDVEGFEESVIMGLTKRIPCMSFEFTREFFLDAKKCIDHLASIGQLALNCSLGESMTLRFERWVAPGELYKRLDSIEDESLWGDILVKFV